MHNFPIPWNESSMNALGLQTGAQRLLNLSLTVGWILFCSPKIEFAPKLFSGRKKKGYCELKGHITITDFLFFFFFLALSVFSTDI